MIMKSLYKLFTLSEYSESNGRKIQDPQNQRLATGFLILFV